MTAWTSPRTWLQRELPTYTQLNAHLRDNLLHLYEKLTGSSAPTALLLPQGASLAPTAEGSVGWDTDDDLLKVGTGAATKTMVDLDSSQELTNKTLTGAIIRGPSNAPQIEFRIVANLANDGVAQLGIAASFMGVVILFDTGDGRSGQFSCRGGNNAATEEVDASGLYTGTATNAGTTNIYWSGGNARYEIENKTGSQKTYHIFILKS